MRAGSSARSAERAPEKAAESRRVPTTCGMCSDGCYLRDTLVYDAADGRVKTHDDPSLGDPALSGSYGAQGRPGRPAFELLREHVAKYAPEKTEGITTIPATTVRWLAREFCEAAHIGETITIDGVAGAGAVLRVDKRSRFQEWRRAPGCRQEQASAANSLAILELQ